LRPATPEPALKGRHYSCSMQAYAASVIPIALLQWPA
jgi:hypothetical protein